MERKKIQRFLTIIIISGLFTLAGMPIVGAESGRVNGELTVNGEVTTLSYVYAVNKQGTFDESTTETEVIFSDVPLSDEAVKNWVERVKLARAGKLKCIVFTIEASKRVQRFHIFYSSSMDNVTGSSTATVFEEKAYSSRMVAGKIYFPDPFEMFGDEIEFSASFNVRISN